MDYTAPSPRSSYELLLNDAELAHLSGAVAMEVRNRGRVFPLSYWRRRVERILETRHLLPAQLTIACALIEKIDAADDYGLPLAKAS